MTTEEQTKYQTQIVNIAGEMVAFTPTGLPKGEPSIVQFDDYYKPQGMSLSDTNILKNALRDLFSSTSLPIFDKELGQEISKPLRAPILPPCDEIQKDLVMRSLQYRFDLLRQELYTRGIRSYQDLKRRMAELQKNPAIGSLEGEDTIDVRRNLKHFHALKKLMDTYETAQQCFNLEDKAFGELELDLTDARARELLKQFVFFTLQAHHPLQEYKKTDPTAPAFVKRLELKPLGEQFPSFMKTYKGNKLPIPESIARVLDSLSEEPGFVEEEAKRRIAEALEKEKQKIINFVLTYFPAEDPFWRTIGDDKDIYRIVERLMERLREAEGEIDGLEAANADLESKRKACEAARATLQQQLARMTAEVTGLRRKLEAAGRNEEEVRRLTEALARATQENEARQNEAAEAMEQAADTIEQNRVRIEQLTRIGEDLGNRVRELEAEVARLRLAEEAFQGDIRQLVQNHERALGQERERTRVEAAAKQAALDAQSAAERDLATAQAEILGKNATLEANAQRIEELERAIRNCEDETTRLRQQLQAKTEEVTRLGQEKAAAEAKKAEAEQAQRGLEQQLQEANDNVEELEGKLRELTKEIAALNFDLADKDSALLAAKAEAAELAKRADAPTQEAAKLKGELEEAKALLNTTKAEKEALQADIERLKNDILQREEINRRLQGQLDTQAGELKTATETATKAEENRRLAEKALETSRGDLATATTRISELDQALLAKNKAHEEQIGEVTATFQAQIDAKVAEASSEKGRADAAEAKVEEMTADIQKKQEAYEILKRAVAALLTIEKDPNEAFAPVEEAEVKDTLRTIFGKLQSLSRASPPSSPAARRAEHMVSQCQNVLLLTYLWQTNFPSDDEESQNVYTMINTIFSSGPYPGKKGQTLPGVYEGEELNVKFYVPLLKKLLSLFSFGNKIREGAAAAKSVDVSPDEISLLEKLLGTIKIIETAYKSEIIENARVNMVRHQPNLSSTLVPEYLKLDKETKKVYCILNEPSQLSYPVVFYMFMIVLRDSLNLTSESLRREGQCPLPKILEKV